MFPLKKMLCIILLLFIQACANSSYHKNNSIASKNLILQTTALINPAIGFSSFVISTSSIQKIYALSDLAYMADNGESIVESALSYSTKKDCKIVNVFDNQNICF